MANIHTLNEINNGAPLVSGNKLGDSPFNRYPSSRTDLENQVTCLKHDLDIALSSGIQLGTRNSLLIKNNESFSERVCQLEDEAREFKNEINQKEISLASTKNEIATKLEEIQALHLRVEELEQDVSLAQKRLSEKETLLQETNTRLAKQILKTSSESEVLGGDKGLEKCIEITSPKTTSVSPNSSFFQHAIIFVVVLLIIYFLWCILSRLYSSYNEEKNIPNYKIPLNRNQGYAFPI